MAHLFGRNQLRELAQQISTEDVRSHIELVKKWHHDYYHGTLKTDKETSREQQYNTDFFKTILGYTEKPVAPYTFVPKHTTEQGQYPDALICYGSEGVEKTFAVVELKGAYIPLDKPQQRENNMSPVQQGFKYKPQYRGCPFVMVSNFYEFRLYNDNMLDRETWTLDDLADPADDYIGFKTWYTLLHVDNFTSSGGVSRTEQLLSRTRTEQEELSKKFYKEYKEARYDLIREIYRANRVARDNFDLCVEKTQKIIDRVVFVCFAEDIGLLPDDIVADVIKASDNSVFDGSLWNALKQFFAAIDGGSSKMGIPDGYNGGLFHHDTVLDNLKIDDDVLREVLKLSRYDFKDQLSVTVLGHIFEQSISDLEEIRTKAQAGETVDDITKSTVTSKRKKDGIFYTPDYIVRYIVDNSLGTYLREHEERCKQDSGLKEGIIDANYKKREHKAYDAYYQFLRGVKVLDPACGSGAFLVYVYDYLLAEHQRVGAILGLNKGLVSFEQVYKNILTRNIYGVDLNEESVEITRLSLWLKSARKGKKLTTLDANIKCGNSLIDDPDFAGNKAFDWNKAFPEIMEQGGFDVVVGNPPYVSVELMHAVDKQYYRNTYDTFYKRSDLFALFVEQGTRKLKDGGALSFIMPSVFLTNLSYAKLRDMLLDNHWLRLVCYTGGRVFDDATVDTTIIGITKTSNKHIELYDARQFDDMKQTIVPSKYFSTYHNVISVSSNDSGAVTDKMFLESYEPLGEHVTIFQGVVTGNNAAFIFENERQALEAGVERELLHPLCHGRDISKWHIDSTERRMLYLDSSHHIEQFPGTKKWLEKYKDDLLQRRECVRGVIPWYSLQWPRKKSELDTKQKIFMQRTRNESLPTRIVASVVEGDVYCGESIIALITKDDAFSTLFLLGILNSKLFNYLFASKFLNLSIKADYLKKVRVPLNSILQREIAELAREITDLHKERAESSRQFTQLVDTEVTNIRWTGKLEGWWQLSFTEFTKSIKTKLSMSQKSELIEVFERHQKKCQVIDEHISRADHHLNNAVYQLYKLSPEEIAIVETGSAR